MDQNKEYPDDSSADGSENASDESELDFDYDPMLHAPVPIGDVNSLEHTARIFGISPRTLQGIYLRGEIESVKVARKTLFTRAAIEAYIKEHTKLAWAPTASNPRPIRRRRTL